MVTGELICPHTNEPCEYPDYCGPTKDFMESAVPITIPSIEGLISAVTVLIPKGLYEASKGSYCSEENVHAIAATAGELLQDPDLSETEASGINRWMVGLAGGILATRETFSPPVKK